MNCLVSFSLEYMVHSAKVFIFSWIPVGRTNITSVYSIKSGVRPIISGTAPDQFEPLQYNLKIHYLERNGQQENNLIGGVIDDKSFTYSSYVLCARALFFYRQYTLCYYAVIVKFL
jgi:hypothetical protein